MKKFSVFLCTMSLVFAQLLVFIGSVSAIPLVIDPVTGEDAVAIDRRFFWTDGLGPIDSIGTPGGGGYGTFDPVWSVTVAEDSTMDAVAVDGFVPGDAFELVFDSVITPWDTSFFDGSGFFHGEFKGSLTTGTHLFTLNVTALAPGYSSGGAWFSFSAAEPVPEPATMLLLGTGLVGFVGIGKKKLFKR